MKNQGISSVPKDISCQPSNDLFVKNIYKCSFLKHTNYPENFTQLSLILHDLPFKKFQEV